VLEILIRLIIIEEVLERRSVGLHSVGLHSVGLRSVGLHSVGLYESWDRRFDFRSIRNTQLYKFTGVLISP
jgi:hypothetical protein